MEKLSEKFAKLEGKIESAKTEIEQKKNEDKTKIENSMNKTKKAIANAEENIRNWAEETRDKGFTEMHNIKKSIEHKKQEFLAMRTEKKYETEKQKKAADIEYSLETAYFFIEMAMVAIDEATLATLEYNAAEKEYEELYGTKE